MTIERGIRLIALVGPIVGRKQPIHKIGMPDGPQTAMPFAEVLYLETDESSCMLYRYTTGGQFCGDTWHQTLEEAKRQAESEYEQALGQWLAVPEAEADGHEYAINYAKTRREA